jgi:glutaredoxin 3
MITLYSKTVCPFCVNAKNYLKNHGIDFAEVNIEQDLEAQEFVRSQGHRTVPQIYYAGKILVEGGWAGLSKMQPEELRNEIELREALNSGTL